MRPLPAHLVMTPFFKKKWGGGDGTNWPSFGGNSMAQLAQFVGENCDGTTGRACRRIFLLVQCSFGDRAHCRRPVAAWSYHPLLSGQSPERTLKPSSQSSWPVSLNPCGCAAFPNVWVSVSRWTSGCLDMDCSFGTYLCWCSHISFRLSPGLASI